jgi:Zn-dependent metalloprotease
MKKILLLFVFVFGVVLSYSQIYYGEKASQLFPYAQILRMKDYSKIPDFVKFSDNVNLSENKVLNLIKSISNDDKIGYIKYQEQKNNEVEITYRYYQTFAGYPVEFSRLHIHSKNGRIVAFNGDVIDKIDCNSQFNISEETALQSALSYVGADQYMWESAEEENFLKIFTENDQATYFPKAEKVIVPSNIEFKNSEFRAAYKFDVYARYPLSRQNVYVDAQSGKVLFSIVTLYNSNAIGTAETQYSGTRQINTWFTGSNYVLDDRTRGQGIRTLNCQNTSSWASAVEFYDDDNYWNNENPQLDQYAPDAHFATMSTYDYFLNRHGRNSIDGNGYRLWSFVHFNLIDYGMSSNVNAFWNGQYMTYGDGNPDQSITPLTTIDICGHEISHGLTTYTSNLNYINESGALNEAFSDIFGTAIEFFAVQEFADWTIGEDIGIVIRSLSNPKVYNKPDTYLGQYWYSGTQDYGGVHTNNGPMAYLFYLLSEGGTGTNDHGNSYSVSAIGILKAENIMFRMQTVYLTPNSNYNDAWFYGMQAAADLYGACSPEVEAVGNAFYAIGVASPYENIVHADFNANVTEACQPPFVVQFINQSYNGDSFLWDFGDGATSTEINPAHMYTSFGSFTVTLTVSGSCGTQQMVKENFVFIDPSIPCFYLMPQSGNQIVEGCTRIIYDAGGPTQNYYDNTDGSITIIAPDGNQIQLNILEFDIEPGSGSYCDYDYIAFYDGTSISAPLINDTYYCNTTGNPGIITSSGNAITIRFYSDAGLALQGFKIQFDCIGSENPPTPYFSAQPLNTCLGVVQFNDNSINNPQQWLWDFGDGNTSSEQNPIHTYIQNGTYNVSLTVSNQYGQNTLTKNNFITVNLLEFPQQNPIEACDGEPFSIELQSSGGTIFWYNSPEDEQEFFSGNFMEHPAPDIWETPIIKYYLREFIHGETFSVGETNLTSGGSFFGNPSYIHYLVFDAYQPFILDSVLVNAQYAGNRTIALRNSNQEIIDVRDVYCPAGVSYISLGFNVPVANNLQLAGLGTPYLFRSDQSASLSYPYQIADVVSIKYSSASSYPTQYYYYFYDWHISSYDCISEFYELNIPVYICDNINQNQDYFIEIYPNPAREREYVTIKSNKNLDNAIFKIIDISGKIIFNDKYSDNSIKLNSLNPGVYTIQISCSHFTINKKFVVVK